MGLWYPDWEFYVETHRIMLRRFGGFPGIAKAGKERFEAVMRKVRETRGDLYVKAAVMLRELRRVRIVEDAQKRTAYTVTATFLEMNGGRMKVTDPEEVNRFLRDMLKYSLDEVVEWIRNGRVPQEGA